MLDHLTLTVRDHARSKAFYQRVLKPLGYGVTMTFEGYCGFGDARKAYFWIKEGKPATQPMHLAFAAPSRGAVDAFHAAALAAGAQDYGEPGLREHYHPDYYGAFVIDPDGHPIEAVCHAPPPQPMRVKKAKKKPAQRKRT